MDAQQALASRRITIVEALKVVVDVFDRRYRSLRTATERPNTQIPKIEKIIGNDNHPP